MRFESTVGRVMLALLVSGLASLGVALAATGVGMPTVLGGPARATGDPVLINEILASHSGTDDTEYVEFYGTPGYNLAGLSLIVVEGDSFSPGTIDRRQDFKPFHEIGSNGFFLFGNCTGLANNYAEVPDSSLFTNYFENSSLTVALVETDSITGETVTGSEVVLSAIALTDGDAGDVFYFGAPVIGPDGTFFPAGARRLVDGVDTGSAADWVIADFFLPGSNTPTGGGWNGCEPLALTIPEIQGEGQFSIFAGEIVTTTGVVTAITANGRDMWIQDPVGDGNPLTSDGIAVDDVNQLDPTPEVGDLVMVTGQVEELQFDTALPLTRIDDPDDHDFFILSSGNPLPEPVPILDLPDFSVPDAIDALEPLEGMRVSVDNGFVVSPTSRFGEFVMLATADAQPNSGYFPQTQQILIRNVGGDQVDYNPERLMVDDSTLEDPIEVMPKDRVRFLIGIMDYTFGMYKIQPTYFDVKTHQLPNLPASKRSGPKGDTVVTTFNVGSLFEAEDDDDLEDLEIQLTKLALAIEIELDLPEIIVVQEADTEAVLQQLGDRVNANTGASYVASSLDSCNGDFFDVGFLWDADRVMLEDYYLIGSATDWPFCPRYRQPLVGEFDVEGKALTIVGNHFNSKSPDDPIFGVNQPMQRPSEERRKAQALEVRAFVNSILDAHPDAMVMVAGDLNDFEFSEPNEGADNPIAILEGFGDEVPLYNLLLEEKAAERFTFGFEGNSEALDHMLVSPALWARTQAADVLHFNVGFASSLAEDDSTPLRASDHDPLEGRFLFKKK